MALIWNIISDIEWLVFVNVLVADLFSDENIIIIY